MRAMPFPAATRFYARMTRVCAAVVMLPLLCARFPAFAGPETDGKDAFTLEIRGKSIEVFTYRPKNFDGGRLIVVMHGMNRNARDYRDNAVTLGDRFGALIAAPAFDLGQFPVEAYQRGGVTRDSKPQPESEWTFRYVWDVVGEMRRREDRPGMECRLIGHSAGGQFLTRLAGFMPGDAARIIAGNPGNLLFPTHDMPFQYGFGGLPEALAGDDALKSYLAAPLTLYLGLDDTGTANLDMTENAMRQGATRIERGRACFRMGEALAREKGWPFGWRLVEAPGVAHDSKALFAHPQAAEALFGGSSGALEPH